ncbi:MAG: cytidine deaminase [Pyrinomonadaceae bacterium]
MAAAKGAREFAVAPFSMFRVGAAVESDDQRIFTGCNVENATYGLTVCAERVSIWKAISEGARSFNRLAVVSDAADFTPPCGACRQIIWELCGDIPIILANARGDAQVLQMSKLYPHPFDSRSLKVRKKKP